MKVEETRLETQVHQRQCADCRHWFWAWDDARSRCFVCDPLPPGELKRLLSAIGNRGEAGGTAGAGGKTAE